MGGANRMGSPPGQYGGLGGGTFPSTDVLPAEAILGQILQGMLSGMPQTLGRSDTPNPVMGGNLWPSQMDMMKGVMPLLMNPAVLQGMLKNVQMFTGQSGSMSKPRSQGQGGGQ